MINLSLLKWLKCNLNQPLEKQIIRSFQVTLSIQINRLMDPTCTESQANVLAYPLWVYAELMYAPIPGLVHEPQPVPNEKQIFGGHRWHYVENPRYIPLQSLSISEASAKHHERLFCVRLYLLCAQDRPITPDSECHEAIAKCAKSPDGPSPPSERGPLIVPYSFSNVQRQTIHPIHSSPFCECANRLTQVAVTETRPFYSYSHQKVLQRRRETVKWTPC